MNNNLISVIIPVYNRAWCIKEALDCVLQQTYKNFELIVVNDGSDDETGQILEKYKDNHENIKVLFQKNRGVSASRNLGILNSSGGFIAFLDSDDLWDSRKLEVQFDYFMKNKNAVVCQTEEIWIRNNKRINPKKRHKKPFGDIFVPSLSLCLVSPSAVMMKKEFFEKAGRFDEKMTACEDYDLWLRSSLLFDFHLIESPLVIKRGGHCDQLSSLPLLDKFRIYSIKKILDNGICDRKKEICAVDKIVEKCVIYMEGCKKRFKMEEYFLYDCLKKEMEKKI
ncbi:MAG: glycosyltransferase family 2 protein [Desulfobacteraceae bacterium]|nr:glycosyltransferase family 2 protein [Desulfobacteraceae bacterium]